MSLDNGDKALLREITREVLAEAVPDIAEKVAWAVVERHAKNCRIAEKVEAKLAVFKWKLIAALLASGMLGGGITGGILKFLPF